MLQTLRFSLFCVIAFFSANIMAMTHQLTPGTEVDFELQPNNPQIFTNAWFWTITATCTIKTEDNSSNIYIEALKKTGKINGESLSEGETRLLTVHPDDKLIITAVSGAKVRLTNQGNHTIIASCAV